MINYKKNQQSLENDVLHKCKQSHFSQAKLYTQLLIKLVAVDDLLLWQQFLLRVYREVSYSKISSILKHPAITLADKLKLFDEQLFDQPGQKVFLKYLIQHHHLQLLPDIIVRLQHDILKFHQIILVKVFTRDYLNEVQTEKLQLKLEAKCQKKVILQNYLDPKIIAGMVIYLNDKKIDYTLRGQLQRLKQHLLEN